MDVSIAALHTLLDLYICFTSKFKRRFQLTSVRPVQFVCDKKAEERERSESPRRLNREKTKTNIF